MQAPSWTPQELAAFRAPDRLTVTEWANRHRYLDERAAPEGGRYSSRRTAYAEEWMNSANCAWVRQITIIAGTQLGKTETLNNLIGYSIHQDPAPVMLVVPRNQDVRTASQRRLRPMVLSSPVLVGELTSQEHDQKTSELAFKRSVVYVRSSQSPADLASVPCRFVFTDEADKFPEWSGKEAPPLDLARERSKNFWNALCVVTTTPTTRDGIGWKEHEGGDKRQYWLPCRHCSAWQLLRFERIVWPKGATARQVERDRLAKYHCEHCAAEITDADKQQMLRAGVWVPQAFSVAQWLAGERERDREPRRSYHLSSLYSPWLSWCDMASKWLRSCDDPATLQNWVNSWLAEPFEDKIDAPTEEAVERCKVPGWRHEAGKIPPGVLVATAGIDVQKDGLWVVVRGWGYGERSWLLFAGHVGDFDSLDDVLFRQSWTSKGPKGIRAGFIDSRHRRGECITYCRRRPDLKMAAGVDRTSPLDFTVSKIERNPTTGQPLKSSVAVWSITVGRFKDQLTARMRNPATWSLPEDVSSDYALQVTAEHKVRKRVRNRDRAIWVTKPGRQANHLGDCEVYAIAAAKMLRVDMLTGPQQQAAPEPELPPRRPIRRPTSGMPRLSDRD
jgi:phage terminase large subunit GpA-like protein